MIIYTSLLSKGMIADQTPQNLYDTAFWEYALIQIKAQKLWLLPCSTRFERVPPSERPTTLVYPLGVSTVPTIARPPQFANCDDRFAQDVVRHKGAPDSPFIRFNAERLRSTTRRDVGSAIAAPFSRCVSMRDTVSIVSPK